MRIKLSNLIKILAFSAVFLLSVATVFYLNTPKAMAGVPGDVECHWKDASHIICTYNSNAAADVATAREDEMNCGGVGNVHPFTCIDFNYDASASTAFGAPVFSGADNRKIYFSTNQANAIYYTESGDAAPAIDAPTNASVTKVSNAKTAADGNTCSILKTGNCDGFDQAGLDATTFNESVTELADLEEAAKTCESKAPLGFIFCPIFEAITEGIGALIGGAGVVQGQRQGLLIDFLKLPVLSVSQPNALNTVVQGMVNVANVFYVVIFLVLIFSSSLPFGLDNYSIKKMLPKFIAAVILTQFSALICAIVIDFFNLLGLLVPNIIFALAPTAATGGATGIDGIGEGLQTGITAGLVTGAVAWGVTVGWILILIFAIIALIAAFIAVIYIIIRFLVLYVLVLLSPLAFAAWVLPGTEKFFYSWWKNFIRLNAMFMVITGLLATSIVLSMVLSASSTITGPGFNVGLDKFIAALLPIAALLLIPKTLKWTTDGMNKLASGVLGAVPGGVNKAGTQGAKSAGKAAKEGTQNQAAEKFGHTRVGGAVAGGGVGALFGTRGGKRRVAAKQAELRAEKTKEAAVEHGKFTADLAREEAVKKQQLAATGLAGTALDDAVKIHMNNYKVDKAKQLVANTGTSKSAQFALMAQAAQSGDLVTLEQLQGTMNVQDWTEGVNSNYGAFDKIAPYRAYDPGAMSGTADPRATGAVASEVSKLTYTSLADLSQGAQKQLGSTHFDHIDGQVFVDARADTTGRAKVSPDLRRAAVAWAGSVGPGHSPADQAKAAQINSSLDASGNWL